MQEYASNVANTGDHYDHQVVVTLRWRKMKRTDDNTGVNNEVYTMIIDNFTVHRY